MKVYYCDGADCGRAVVNLSADKRNTVTIRNAFNKKVTRYYCASCAEKIWPDLAVMFGWTRGR